MNVNPKQSETASSDTYWKHLAVNAEELEYISKALANMVAITERVTEDTENFSSPFRFEIKDVHDKYLKLKGKIDLV